MKLPTAFSPEVLAELARPYVPFDPSAVEIVEREAKWWVAHISTRDAERELIKRKFGIYVPESELTAIVRGRRIERRVPMLAGYVFVFLWDTPANVQRIWTTPGVISVLGSIEDVEIARLSFHESCERLAAMNSIVVQSLTKIRRPVRRKKPSRKISRRGKSNRLLDSR